jgi:hypothetical protein
VRKTKQTQPNEKTSAIVVIITNLFLLVGHNSGAIHEGVPQIGSLVIQILFKVSLHDPKSPNFI